MGELRHVRIFVTPHLFYVLLLCDGKSRCFFGIKMPVCCVTELYRKPELSRWRWLLQGVMEFRHTGLLVCTWRHGGHVGDQEQKHFSPRGTKLYFHVNFSRKYSFVLSPNMAALSRGCKPRIVVDRSSRPYGTDIKIINDYGEVLEAFILSDQINKTRLRKVFLRTFFRKFERHMKQI